MVGLVLFLRIRFPARRRLVKKKLNFSNLATYENKINLAAEVEESLMQNAPSQKRSNNWVEDSWEHIPKSLMTVTEQVLGDTMRKNAD